MTRARTWLFHALHIPEETARMFWELAAPAWPFLLLACVANLLAAIFEGSTIAALAVALRALSGAEQVSLAAVLGRFGGWYLHQEIVVSREALFLTLVSLAVVMQVLRSGLQFLGVVATAQVQMRAQREAYGKLFERMMRSPFPSISRYRLGDLTDSLGQVRYLHDVFAHLNVMISTASLVVMYVLLLLWISWPMTLAALLIYGVVSAALRRVIGQVRHHADYVTRVAQRFSERTTELLQAMRLIHTFARQEQEIRAVEEMTHDWVSHRRRAAVWAASVPLIMDVVTVVGVAVFLVGGYRVVGHGTSAPLPHLLTFLIALYRMAPRIGALHNSAAVLATYMPNIGRVATVLSAQELNTETAGRGARFDGLREAIVFDHVTLQYHPGEPAAVDDLSFRMPRGSLTAIVGASGAGKSSVSDLLLRLYTPTAGSIVIDGVALEALDVTAWRNRLGMVSQESFLFHASVRDNIVFGKPGATEAEVNAAARAAHADEFIQRLAEGYDTVVGDRGYRLSGGQRQRIALARALIRQPDILVLDEATSALDSESERLIQQAMNEQRGRRTVLAIAHRLSTVLHADHILVLEHGRLVEQGTHEQLLANHGPYARLWRLQSDGLALSQQAPSMADLS